MKKEELSLFSQFAKSSIKNGLAQTSNAVIYTRVSSKEQAENNMSLDTQLKYCNNYSENRKFNVLGYFGGTFESAFTDERKEFIRMMTFIKKSKEKISYIIVYSLDRFSRTGGNAIYISENLKKQGVVVMSVTQQTDSTTSAGTFQQNMQFIFSQYENELRREKCYAGVKERLLRGLWIGCAPIGYDQYSKGKEQFIKVNAQGKLLRKAFEWKAEQNMPSVEILSRLKSMGLIITKQRLSDVFRNPFYCGIISHRALDGHLVEGKHEKLVSRELFLKANDIVLSNQHKWKHEPENPEISLKKFIKCDMCGTPFAGYIVKKKGLYYYKCNKIGCKCNKSAKVVNEQFYDLLRKYTIEESLAEIIQDLTVEAIHQLNNSVFENKEILENQLKEASRKLDMLHEKFFTGEVQRDVYDRFTTKYKEEIANINQELSKSTINLSNLDKKVKNATYFACNLHNLWNLGSYAEKEGIQKKAFPDGIYYNVKNECYRTERVNSIFEIMYTISNSLGKKIGDKKASDFDLSPLVASIGLQFSIMFRQLFKKNTEFLIHSSSSTVDWCHYI